MKSILLDIKFKGNGIVNFDDNSRPLQIMKNLGLTVKGDNINNKNNKIAKHHYEKIGTKTNSYGEVEDVYGYKIIVSSDCLRHGIFGRVPSTEILYNDKVMLNYLTSEVALCRGYLFLSDKYQYKKSSPLTITNAEQEDINTEINLQTHSVEGAKKDDKTGNDENSVNNSEDDEKSKANYYMVETIGEKTYHSRGKINLSELMFISADCKFDRLAVEPDFVFNGQYQKMLKNHYGDIANAKVGYWQLKSEFAPVVNAEYGVLLNNELVEHMVKRTLHRILNMEINRATATFNVETLRIKFVNNIFTDTYDNEEGWITITSDTDIDELNGIYPDDFYCEVTEDEFKEHYKVVEKEKIEEKKRKEIKKAKEEENKTKAKANREKKAKEKTEKENEVVNDNKDE